MSITESDEIDRILAANLTSCDRGAHNGSGRDLWNRYVLRMFIVGRATIRLHGRDCPLSKYVQPALADRSLFAAYALAIADQLHVHRCSPDAVVVAVFDWPYGDRPHRRRSIIYTLYRNQLKALLHVPQLTEPIEMFNATNGRLLRRLRQYTTLLSAYLRRQLPLPPSTVTSTSGQRSPAAITHTRLYLGPRGIPMTLDQVNRFNSTEWPLPLGQDQPGAIPQWALLLGTGAIVVAVVGVALAHVITDCIRKARHKKRMQLKTGNAGIRSLPKRHKQNRSVGYSGGGTRRTQ